jgi:hypothetical protein
MDGKVLRTEGHSSAALLCINRKEWLRGSEVGIETGEDLHTGDARMKYM